MENEICTFVADKTGSFCKILIGEKCDGRNKCCSFYKTAEKFQSENDKAIAMNRENGNCMKCKYMATFCKMSSEETVVENFF